MATHFSIGKSHGQEELGGLQSMGQQYWLHCVYLKQNPNLEHSVKNVPNISDIDALDEILNYLNETQFLTWYQEEKNLIYIQVCIHKQVFVNICFKIFLLKYS